MHTDEVAQVALELLCVAGECSDPFGLFASDTDPRSLWHRSEATGHALQLAWVVELASRDPRLQLGVEDHEVDPQPVDQLCALVDEHFAVIAQQPDLHGVLVEERGRETLDALTENGSGYRASIDLVGLPWLAFAAA